MRVVLLFDLKRVGKKGEVVEVAGGYGKHYLIPKKLAEFADESTVKAITDQKIQSQKKAASDRKEIHSIADRLTGKVLNFSLPAAPGGRLYAALKDSEILARIKQLEPGLPTGSRLEDFEPIKTAGEHIIRLEFLSLETVIKVSVTAQG